MVDSITDLKSIFGQATASGRDFFLPVTRLCARWSV